MQVAINITSMWCERTNDNFMNGNEDEVTWYVAGKRSDGHEYKWQFPRPDNYWNAKVNDDGSARSVVGATNIWTDDLADGQSVELVIACIEVDGGNAGNFMEITSKILQSTDNPYAIAAGIVGGIVGVYLENDVLGTFAIRAENNGGHINYMTHSIDSADEYHEPGINDKRFHRLTGSGGQYSIGIQAVPA